jgi:FkbM family methyltransferase
MWLLYNDIMDWPEFPFLQSYLRAGDTVVDVGANIGIYALWMSRFIGASGTLIAFEPSAECFSRLSRQVAQNGLDRIVLERKAVADVSGSMRLTRGRDMENRVLAESEVSDDVEAVDVVTLDEYARTAAMKEVNFLKIDVEGAEALVMDGADSLLRQKRIAVMQFEVEAHWARYGRNLPSMAERLRQYGYTPFAPDDLGTGISGVGDWNSAIRGQNLLVTRSIVEVSGRLRS